MDKKLSKKLNDCGVKKSQIESLLKMPKNSLVGMINGTRPTPDKWAKKLQEYVDGKIIPVFGVKGSQTTDISQALKNLTPLPFPIPEKPYFAPPWVKKIEDYCGIAGIVPEDLIDVHKTWSNRMSGVKEAFKNQKTILTTTSNEVIDTKNIEPFNSPIRGNDNYNPNDNWRFKSKMKIKDKPDNND